jgi:hypothetical protein
MARFSYEVISIQVDGRRSVDLPIEVVFLFSESRSVRDDLSTGLSLRSRQFCHKLRPDSENP